MVGRWMMNGFRVHWQLKFEASAVGAGLSGKLNF